MASSSGNEDGDTGSGAAAWRLAGPAAELSQKPCRLMYSPLGHKADVCLFHVKGEFFAMDARCSHSGKDDRHHENDRERFALQMFCLSRAPTPW